MPDTGSSRRGIVALAVWFVASLIGAVGLLAVQPFTGPAMEVLSLLAGGVYFLGMSVVRGEAPDIPASVAGAPSW